MNSKLVVATCAVTACALLSSCHKEDRSVVELANELTAELATVTDTATADAHSDRIKVLNKRFQDASARVLAINSTALLRGAESDGAASPGTSYAKALQDLSRELGRVTAGYPASVDAEGPDETQLYIAIAAAQGKTGTPEEMKESGKEYMTDMDNPHDEPVKFPEYYGSERLKDALSYRVDVESVSSFDMKDPEPVPAMKEAKAEAPQSDDAASSGESSADTGDAGDDGADGGVQEPATDDSEEPTDSEDSGESSDDAEPETSDDSEDVDDSDDSDSLVEY